MSVLSMVPGIQHFNYMATIYFPVLQAKPRAPRVLDKCSAIDLHSNPKTVTAGPQQ